MRPIGFSTGALAKGDFRQALQYLSKTNVSVLELSALRQHELEPLCRAVDELDLSQFSYISIHAPSRVEDGSEPGVVRALVSLADRGWPIVVHPDAIRDYGLWRVLGQQLLVENMDNRKPQGRNVKELDDAFKRLPDAWFCFDIGHARQFDPTMTEAGAMLQNYRTKLTQLHASEVNTKSHHERLNSVSQIAFRRVASLIPQDVPVILETPVSANEIEEEIKIAESALAPRTLDPESESRSAIHTERAVAPAP